MAYSTVRYVIEENILTLTLNRPQRMNAFNDIMRDELIAAFDAADADDSVRVIIVTGEGGAFCAGADLDEGGDTFNLCNQRGGEGAALRDSGGALSLRIFESTKPVIGALNGAAVGIGITMTLPMDIRLASSNARFGFVFARRGITMEAASSWFLPRLVGPMLALEWAFTGRIFHAEEALRGGLIRSIHEPDELLPAARNLAREIADNTSAMSNLLNRQLIWRMLGADHPIEAHIIDSRTMAFMGASIDAREGVESFLAKRPAKFELSPSKDRPAFYPWWHERKFR
ncbi:crotonase/enoyl-CoA hydratase family protein [Pseudomonas hefeiensis]|uniref:Crotonase/enoyl-CoA hydratase family protein n=1 Tax=Pseudomonas hefeiensis TaxID=2738125 RepID=A0ABY9GGU4_9PSED|nr:MULTISPECIES: crotonase/enoyl-CoA hydratase family protein [unclassified Pseudomonas]WLH14819.1 crotonase/enoyl-CoA hydratase family protein [Pseudomonas sp. FP205]WLH97872.1 crotonase/enoyl-CoA hydratase family protein [Pseudomonas sp. FP53]WLI42145.1 crotonase/enoyl-CoA hydratase family protein [Pseudomonas sp. FP821]